MKHLSLFQRHISSFFNPFLFFFLQYTTSIIELSVYWMNWLMISSWHTRLILLISKSIPLLQKTKTDSRCWVRVSILNSPPLPLLNSRRRTISFQTIFQRHPHKSCCLPFERSLDLVSKENESNTRFVTPLPSWYLYDNGWILNKRTSIRFDPWNSLSVNTSQYVDDDDDDVVVVVIKYHLIFHLFVSNHFNTR
jgi:hypothetical protein